MNNCENCQYAEQDGIYENCMLGDKCPFQEEDD